MDLYSGPPWRNWYHCIGNTFGTWLPGDPRGFRTRHHREPVEGDYRQPPAPGRYDAKRRRAAKQMTRPPVYLTPAMRTAACLAMGEKLAELNVGVIDLAITEVHYHLLARFTPYSGDPHRPATPSPHVNHGQRRRDELDPAPRVLLGLAKKHSSHVLREQGLRSATGGLWAVRGGIRPIADRTHQVNVAHYIAEHVEQGAATLSTLRPEGIALRRGGAETA